MAVLLLGHFKYSIFLKNSSKNFFALIGTTKKKNICIIKIKCFGSFSIALCEKNVEY